MAIPQVAIVGRPNVGKSSLFNWLAGRRIAIVDPTAGVTRDRLTTLVRADDRFFELVDTGGLGIEDVDGLTADIERQINNAIEQAAVILFIVDARRPDGPGRGSGPAAAARDATGDPGGEQVRHAGTGAAGRGVLQARPGPAGLRQRSSRTVAASCCWT